MADTPTSPPTPPRRKATGPRKTTRATPPKSVPSRAEGATATDAEGAAPLARKAPVKRAAAAKAPARKRAAPKPVTTTARVKTAAAKVSTSAGKAAGKVVDTASAARRSAARSAPVKLVSDTRDRMGDRNFFAAVIGGVAALGAAVGGIFYALRDGHSDTPGDPTAKD